MKQFLFFALLLISVSATAQISENTLIGKWKVSEVIVSDDDPGTRQLYQGFKDAIFVFSADHHMQFSSPSASRTFGLIASKLAANDWLLQGSDLHIGSKADRYQTMHIRVENTTNGTVFVLDGTPVRLKMTRN